jgi:hypothetical protein
MMASFMSYFTGRRDAKQTARDAIVSLREQLMMIEKKEEHLQRQIAQDLATAKANAVSNKTGTPLLHLPPSQERAVVIDMMIGLHAIPLVWILVISGHCCAQTEEDARVGP